MSTIYSTGPVRIFVGTGVGKQLEFLGWTESELRVSFREFIEEVPADYAGAAPADLQIMGREAYVEGTLVRFNEAVLDRAAVRFRGAIQAGQGEYPVYPAAPAATTMPTEIGSLLYHENLFIPLCLVTQFGYTAPKAVMVNNAMKPLLYFPFAVIYDNYSETWGSRRKRVPLNFRCLTGMDPTQSTYDINTPAGVLAYSVLPNGVSLPQVN